MVIMNDLEWPYVSYYVIYYWKFKYIMQQTEKEALQNDNQEFWTQSKHFQPN